MNHDSNFDHRRVISPATIESSTVLDMTPPTAAPEVHTSIEAGEFWVMAAPDVDTSAIMGEAKSLGYNEIKDQWYDPEHDWDVLVLTRT